MSPTKENSRSKGIENFSVSLKEPQNSATFKKDVRSSKSKWQILAQAIRKSGSTSKNTSKEYDKQDLNQENTILRYPSYGLIQCNKAPRDACDTSADGNSLEKHDIDDKSEENRRLWYHVVSKRYGEISLKVCYLNFLSTFCDSSELNFI